MNRHLPVVAVVLLLCSLAVPVAAQDDPAPMLRLRELKTERLAARPQATAVAMAAKTVVVDCAKGGTIAAALAKNTGPLVVEVRGTCRENVRIERSDLTLRGADPSTDGIRGITANPQPSATIELNYANRIVLENLFVSDSPSGGVGAWWSELVMRNCRIERNHGTGIHISAASGLAGTEVVVSGSGRYGLNSQRGSDVTCTGCRLVAGSTHAAAMSMSGGFMTLWDTEVSGTRGIRASGSGSYIDVDCANVESAYPCGINVDGYAAASNYGGEANLWGVGPFIGSVRALTGGLVGIYGSQQAIPSNIPANQQFNRIDDSARLTTTFALDARGEQFGDPTTLGKTVLSGFAHAFLYDETQLSGTLECRNGSDAWSDTAYPASKVINCATVPTTP